MILGVSYKKGIDDYRESPAIEIAKILNKKNFNIYYHDPYIKNLNGYEKKFFTNSRSIKISSKKLNILLFHRHLFIQKTYEIILL